MPDLITAEQAIRSAPVGTMIYARLQADVSAWSTGLLIREDRTLVRRLGAQPTVELRAGVIEQGGVILVALMAQIGGQLYETWFNYHGAEEATNFADLGQQETIPIVFFVPDRARSLVVINHLRQFFQEAAERCERQKPWAMSDFDAAREHVYATYPEVEDLWAHLGRNPPGGENG